MFGKSPFGKRPFGRGSIPAETSSDLTLPFSASEFLPDGLAGEELYSEVSKVLDYVMTKYHHEQLQKMAGLYDVFHPSFDSSQILKFLGGAGFIVRPLTDDQRRSLCLLLSNLYEVKGIRKGVEGILSAVGIPAMLYESWEVSEEVETGRSSRRPRPESYEVNMIISGGRLQLSMPNDELVTGDAVLLDFPDMDPDQSPSVPDYRREINKDVLYYLIKTEVGDKKHVQLALTKEDAYLRKPILLTQSPCTGLNLKCGSRFGFPSAIWTEKIDPCSVAVVFDATGKLITANIDTSLKQAIGSLLWVCAQLKSLIFVLDYRGPGREDESFLPNDEDLEFLTSSELCDKYMIEGDEEWCLLFPPIIESVDTPNEEKVLAIYTEKPVSSDITVKRKYESPTYDGFLLVDWQNASPQPPQMFLDNPWSYDPVAHKASISLPYNDLDNASLGAPLFYFLSKTGESEQTPISGVCSLSFTVKSNAPCVVVYGFLDKDKTAADLISGSIQIPSLSAYTAQEENNGVASTQFRIVGEGYTEITPWPIICDTSNPVFFLQIFPAYSLSTSVEIRDLYAEITPSVSEEMDWSPLDLYSPFMEYYTTLPTSSHSHGSLAVDGFDLTDSRIIVPFHVVSGQSFSFTDSVLPDIFPDLSSSYVVIDPEYSENGTSFQFGESLENPIVLPDIEFNASHSFIIEFDADTYNSSQTGSANSRGLGWCRKDSPWSALDSDWVDYDFIDDNGDLEISVNCPIGSSIQYNFAPFVDLSTGGYVTRGMFFSGIAASLATVQLSQGKLNVDLSVYGTDLASIPLPASRHLRNLVSTPGTSVIFKLLAITGGGMQFKLSAPIDTNFKKLSEFTIDYDNNTLSCLAVSFETKEDDKIYLKENTTKLLGTGFYFVVNYTLEDDICTFQLSLTQGGEPVVLQDTPDGDCLSFLYIPPMATITNISFLGDSEFFLRGEYTFEENDDWQVNAESQFWKVACDFQEICCPDGVDQLITIGEDLAIINAYNGDNLIMEGWDMAVESSEVPFSSVVDTSDLIPVDFNWAAGTEVRLSASLTDPNESHPLPSLSTGDQLLINTGYYVIPYDKVGEFWRIKLASSYQDAVADPPVPLNLGGNSSEPGNFVISGSQIPPILHEILLQQN